AQRYYASSYGRFNTPDPYQASAGPADPGSWNRYSYTRGDPVNRFDPQGTNDAGPDGFCSAQYQWCDEDGVGHDGGVDTAGTHPCSVLDLVGQLGELVFGVVNTRSYGSYCPDLDDSYGGNSLAPTPTPVRISIPPIIGPIL